MAGRGLNESGRAVNSMPPLTLSALLHAADGGGVARRCPDPPRRVTDNGRQALRRRIYNISHAPDLRVVWRQSFNAFEHEPPHSLVEGDRLCQWLAPQQWPFCKALAAAKGTRAQATGARAAAPVTRRTNELLLVSMPCAFTDDGTNYRGALYDGTRVLNAQHRAATPRFARGDLRRYDVAAVALTPYGHLADAHFYASTAAWVLQLLELLPQSVPILVARSKKVWGLFEQMGLPMERLHTLPVGGAAYADRLLSLVTIPFGALEPLGAEAMQRVRARLQRLSRPPGPMPVPPDAGEVPSGGPRAVIYLSRARQHPRRSLSNRASLLAALTAAVRPRRWSLEVFDGGGKGGKGKGGGRSGSGWTLAETAHYFSRAGLLVGPHGGAFLNMVYCRAGTPIVEIGWRGTKGPMAFPSYYHTLSRRLGLELWVVLGRGAYDRPIEVSVDEVDGLVQRLMDRHR